MAKIEVEVPDGPYCTLNCPLLRITFGKNLSCMLVRPYGWKLSYVGELNLGDSECVIKKCPMCGRKLEVEK
jgi:hypothetical protein